MEQMLHHLMVLERQVQRGEKDVPRVSEPGRSG
jgi:hypothetical protein